MKQGAWRLWGRGPQRRSARSASGATGLPPGRDSSPSSGPKNGADSGPNSGADSGPDTVPGLPWSATAPGDPLRAAPAAGALPIREALPRRRRRLGLALVALGVAALGAQGVLEWVLPYDDAALALLRHLWNLPGLSAVALLWLWCALCLGLMALLALTEAPPRAVTLAAAAAGAALGSAYLAAGGPAASVAVVLLVGVATLGWHSPRHGGLALLVSTALAVAGWEIWLSDHPTVALVAAALVALFVWIEVQHIQASDTRLFDALNEREALIRRLDERGLQLTQLQGERIRLLAGISHDLRQPLQAVRLYADALMGRDGAESSRRLELLRQQMRAADDAVAMLDQFSEFGAIEHGMLSAQTERVDLRDVLDGVADALRAQHPPTVLDLRVHGRHEGVWADRTLLARLVQNLAGNAVRYSVGWRPGQAARVLLAVRPHAHGGLLIDVVDNGRGIAPEQLQRIFEPYVQLPHTGPDGDARPRSGRGLGLAIVRGLVVQLGLTLAPVHSIPGRGTRFRVLVPASLRRELTPVDLQVDVQTQPLPADAAALTGAQAGGQAGAHAGAPAGTQTGTHAQPDAGHARLPVASLEGRLIALLDDEATPRRALQVAMESAGATVIGAATLAELQARLDEEPRFPDALVVDLDLGPGQPDGIAAVSALRRAWELEVPALIVSGRLAARSTVTLPPRSTLLPKPVHLAMLAAALARLPRAPV